MTANSNLVTCLGCGRVYMGVSMRYAIDEVSRFNQYFDSLSLQERINYYGNKKSSINNYLICYFCGNHCTNFRDSLPGDCSLGSTINPILDFREFKNEK